MRPQLDADGTYRDAEGTQWTVAPVAARKLGVNEGTVRRRLPDDATSLPGLDRGGRKAVLYRVDDIQSLVADVLGVTREIKTGEVYTTSTGRRYATLPTIVKILDIPLTILLNRRDGVRTLMVRIRNRDNRLSRVVPIFCLEDFAKHPEIKAMLDGEDREPGFLPDDWLTVDAFFNSLSARIKKKTSKKAIRRQVQKACTSKASVRPGTRPGAKLYRREDLWKTGLCLVNAEIKVDRKTGFYRDEGENKWATRDTWEKKKDVTGNALNYGMQKLFGHWENTPRIRGLGMMKREDWLYSEEIINGILAFIFEAEYQLRDGRAVYRLTGETHRKVQRVYSNADRIAQQAHVSADQVRKRLDKENCIAIRAIHRHTGQEFLLYDLNSARRIFRDQIMIRVEVDDSGDIDDPVHGRCLTLTEFIKKQGQTKNVPWIIKFSERVKKQATRLRRRNRKTHRLCSYYPERELLNIAGRIAA